MAPVLVAGVAIVNLALISYGIGIVLEQRRRRVTHAVLGFLTAGVAFDVTATTCMILGSRQSPFEPHGLIGYSALALMLTDTVQMWRHRARAGDGPVPSGLHAFSRFAYVWWVLAYVTGAILVAMAHRRG